MMGMKSRLNVLRDKLVPPFGMAHTVAGEMIRAVMRVDDAFVAGGDRPGTGCGIYTCNAPLRYLKEQFPGEVAACVDALWDWQDLSDEEYEGRLRDLERAVLAHIDRNPGTGFMENRIRYEWFVSAYDREGRVGA